MSDPLTFLAFSFELIPQSLRARGLSLRGRSPSHRAIGPTRPEAGAAPEPEAEIRIRIRQLFYG
ncbi:MAG: hypothetical protein MUO26_10450 [Methanotrichaceae archaeon]|nr:hypothetical protein [Methanotrichaceae archaeon]